MNWQVNSSSIFVSFFIVMTDNHPVSCKLIYFLLWIKGSLQSPNFETFKCSGEHLPNSSCHFLNHRLVFIQILHLSSVSWKITPLYFFSWNILYFKVQIKVQIFEIFKCSCQNSSNSILQCQVYSLSNFSSFFSIITNNSSVNFNSCIFYFRQKDPKKVSILRLSTSLVRICRIAHVTSQTTS